MSEILALRWDDLDAEKKTLRIERAIEDSAEHGHRIKGPKTERGKRTIVIDDDLLTLCWPSMNATCALLPACRMG